MSKYSQCGAEVSKKSLKDHGFTTISFPSAIAKAMRDEVRTYVERVSGGKVTGPTDGAALAQTTNLVVKFDDSKFVDLFQKTNRFFSDSIARSVYGFVEELCPFLGGSRAAINYVSPEEAASNAILTPKSFDVFWRCVRPKKPDVGQPHADFQFWEIHRGTPLDVPCPFDYDERWKIWLPLWGCTKGNSLRVIPESHLEEIPFTRRQAGARIKPDIAPEWLATNGQRLICPLDEFSDSCILFHDKLVHKGPTNEEDTLRISAEFTIILKK